MANKIRRKDVLLVIPLIALFAMAAFVFSTETANAETLYEGTCGDNATWTLDDQGVLTISGEGATYDYNGSTATPWSDYLRDVQTIVVEEGISTIGNHLFAACNVTSVTLPNTIETIGSYAFASCSELETIELPESLETINKWAFSKCSRLTGLTIPCNVSTIGSAILNECDSLEYIRMECSAWDLSIWSDSIEASYEGVVYYPENDLLYDDSFKTYFARNATWVADGTVDVVTIDEGQCGENATWSVSNIGAITIDGSGEMENYNGREQVPWTDYRSKIHKIVIGEDITTIGGWAFYGTRAKELTIPGHIKSFGVGAFSGCSLERVVLQDGITTISGQMFSYCDKLSEITLPETLETIGNSSFMGCSSLSTITIPKNVISFGSATFSGCRNLEAIRFKGSPPAFVTNAFSEHTGEIYYPGNDEFWDEETRNAWAPDATWIPEGEISVDIIDEGRCGDDATWELSNQGVLTISGTGKTDDYKNKPNQEPPWSKYRSSIRKIVFKEGITRVGSYIWSSGSAGGSQSPLKKIEFSNTVSEIGEQAFYGAVDVTKVTLPEGLKKIESNAFSWTGIEEIVIPGTFEAGYRGFSAFSYCKQLSKVKFEQGVTEIDDSLFRGCDSLQTIELPDSLTTIQYGAFAQCTSLKVSLIPENVSYIGRFAFSECDDLETIIFKGDPPLNLESGVETAFEGFAGTVYYPADNSKWSETVRNDWAPDATWKDCNTVIYDATGDTEIVSDGTETATTISDDEVQSTIEEIKLVQPKHVVVNAKVSDGTENVEVSRTQIPVNIVQAASDVGATFAADTIVGKIQLDKASVDGAVSEETESIELNIAFDSDQSDMLTVVHDVEFKVKDDATARNIIDLAGTADVTVPTPPGTLENDVISSSYLGLSGEDFVSDASLVASTNNIVRATTLDAKSTDEPLETTRTKNTVTAKTKKTGIIKSTSDSFKNARVSADNLVYNGKSRSAKNPKVTIGSKRLSSQEYKIVSCTNNKNVGKAILVAKGMGKYSGTKTGGFNIKPKKAVISKVKVGKKKITVKMKTKPSATGGSSYKIQYRIAGTTSWKTTTTTKKTKTIKKLKKGKKYQVRVLAYKGNQFGAYSAIKNSKKVR